MCVTGLQKRRSGTAQGPLGSEHYTRQCALHTMFLAESFYSHLRLIVLPGKGSVKSEKIFF